MDVKVRTEHLDRGLSQIVDALKEYQQSHPHADIETYRHNSVSVRIRIIDKAFEGLSRAGREDELWPILERLPEEIVAEISLLLLLTTAKAKQSFANFEFDHPVPSNL